MTSRGVVDVEPACIAKAVWDMNFGSLHSRCGPYVDWKKKLSWLLRGRNDKKKRAQQSKTYSELDSVLLIFSSALEFFDVSEIWSIIFYRDSSSPLQAGGVHCRSEVLSLLINVDPRLGPRKSIRTSFLGPLTVGPAKLAMGPIQRGRKFVAYGLSGPQ
jgi:hypothetical protein